MIAGNDQVNGGRGFFWTLAEAYAKHMREQGFMVEVWARASQYDGDLCMLTAHRHEQEVDFLVHENGIVCDPAFDEHGTPAGDLGYVPHDDPKSFARKNLSHLLRLLPEEDRVRIRRVRR